MEIGTPELLIILFIILLVFGVGRISRIGGELGQGLREFRRGLRGDDDLEPVSSSRNTSESGQQPVEEQKIRPNS